MHKAAICFSAFALVIATSAVSSAQMGAKVIMPGQLHWTTNSQTPKGSAIAPLAGNPNGTGWFVLRVRMNPGVKFRPHMHKNTEILSVISGTLGVGFGKTQSMSNVTKVPAGGVVVIPAGVPHYTMAEGAVVYDVSGMGPSTNLPVK